jgi:hypothetical protein
MQSQESRRSIADAIAARLAIILGPHTARTAVKTFTQKALGRGPETLTAADVPKLADALRPLLRTFIGRVQADLLVEQLKDQMRREAGA